MALHSAFLLRLIGAESCHLHGIGIFEQVCSGSLFHALTVCVVIRQGQVMKQPEEIKNVKQAMVKVFNIDTVTMSHNDSICHSLVVRHSLRIWMD